MHKLKDTILLLTIIFPCFLLGQTRNSKTPEIVEGKGCAVDGLMNTARKSAMYISREAQMNRQIILTPATLDVVYTLPVVFHVIGNDTLSDQAILAYLQDLNDAFAKSGKYASGNGIDTKIRFCLAKTAPDGGITNGITRTSSFYGNDLNRSIEDARLKNLVFWDPSRYINIWYVNNIRDENFVMYGCAVNNGSQWTRYPTIGYATMPVNPLDSADGIVVSQTGAVLAHEMGHYLGLYHTFEGGCRNNDCTVDGDRVCDTPPDGSWLPSSCSNPTNTCNTDTLSNYSNGFFKKDVPDQVANFMDYNNWSCANMFTNGQATRMRAAIVSFRSSLLWPACNPPCPDNITASFTRSLPYPVPGQAVAFTNTSTGASNYQWYLNGNLISSAANFSYTFPDTGKYELRLKAFNNPSCFASATDEIIVNCGVSARFFADKRQIASQLGFTIDSIQFTNTSYNATSFQWLVGNDAGMAEHVESTSKNFTYTFPAPGNYTIRLVATNGSCSDTTLPFTVPVADPRPDVRPVIYRADCYETTKIKIEFGVCNNGYTPIPPGVPISFYDADPRFAGAKKIGPTFLLPDSVRGGGAGACCSPQYSLIVDALKPHLDQIFVSFNDKGDSVPVNYPGSPVIEKNYTNNLTVMKFFQYAIVPVPPSATVLPGDTIRLLASSSPAGTSSVYNWFPANGLTCTNCANPILVADSSRIYYVLGKSQYGCIDTAQVDITVPAAYDYSLTIDTIVCTSNSDSLTVKFTVYNSYKKPILPKGLTVAFYDNNPATTIAGLLKPLFILPATYNKANASFSTTIKSVVKGNVYAVVNDSGTTYPLKLPNTSFVETNYTNNIALKYYDPLAVSASNGGPVCEKDSLKLFATANIAGASFSWTGPNGYTSNLQNPVFVASLQSAGLYSATATLSGCSSPASTTNIIINKLPLADASYLKPVCDGGTLNLIASGDASNKYAWTGPNSFTSNIQNPVINNISTAASGIYQVIAVDSLNCISVPSNLPVNVNPLPVAGFSAPDVCMPVPNVPFKNESTVSTGSIGKYFWDFGDAASGNANTDTVANPTHLYSSYGKYLVLLKVTSNEGCSASTSKLFSGIHLQPVAKFITDHPNGICTSQEITFFDKSTGDEGTITSWTWNAGDGSSPVTYNSGTTPYKHIYQSPGIYNISLNVKNNFTCEDTLSLPVNIFALPTVDAGPDQYVLEGRSTQLNATTSPDVIKYSWSPGSYLSSTSVPNPSVISPSSDIAYTLTVSTGNGCTATDDIQIKILKPLQIPNVFSPNGDGINDVWNVRYLADYPGCNVDIFDRYGKLVFHSVGYNKPWDGTINGAPVPVGVYYYIITPKNGASPVNGSVTVLR